jgi:hypothetical protein
LETISELDFGWCHGSRAGSQWRSSSCDGVPWRR